MHIGQVLDAVYDGEVGWRPSSGGIKPVHVANGMVRALQRKYYDTSQLNEFAVWWQQGRIPDERRAMDALKRTDTRGALRGITGSPQEFDRLRRYVLGLIGADKALFPAADKSSFTLTCGRMASRDDNDRGLGDFAAVLLAGGGETRSLAEEVLDGLADDKPGDPVTSLVWPLLSDKAYDYKPKARTAAVTKAHNREALGPILAAADTLATHEKSQGNRLHTLHRAVHFACVATHVHAQSLSGNGEIDKRPPALLVMGGPRRSDLAAASERSLDIVYGAFEEWLADRLTARLQRDGQLGEEIALPSAELVDGRSMRAFLSRIGSAKRPHDTPSKDELDGRLALYREIHQDMSDATTAAVVARTLVSCYVDEYDSGGPRRFLQALGRKAGLLYPHFQGNAREKRVRPSVAVLDMMVRSCVSAGQLVPLQEFLATLWERFGLIVGGRREEEWDDVDVLGQWGLAVDPEELKKNTEALVDELVMMGLARRYPDDVAFVGDGHGA